jgi:hypothetical protein
VLGRGNVHVVVVLSPDVVNVKCDTGGESKGLEKMGDHLCGYWLSVILQLYDESLTISDLLSSEWQVAYKEWSG